MKKLKVIPDGWSERHRPAAYGFLTGLCRANGPDEETAWTPDNPAGIVPGPSRWTDEQPCSVQVMSEMGREVVAVGTSETIITHRVSLPIDCEVEPHDVITVTENPDDLRLNGTRLRVVSVGSGTTNWTRDIGCEELNRGD